MSKWQCSEEQARVVHLASIRGGIHTTGDIERTRAAITAAIGPDFDELREALRELYAAAPMYNMGARWVAALDSARAVLAKTGGGV